MRNRLPSWIGVLALATPGLAPAQSLSDLPAFIEQVRQVFNVPGIAVAIVKDDQIVFEQGAGQRDLASAQPVDAHTMFCIASNTKSFTATAIEMLADQGKLRLDDRVVDHLPWFRMSDPYVTHEMRIRDLLAHRSGLGSHAGDLLFTPPSSYSARQVVERLKYLPLKSGFRDSFAYENIMFSVATLLIEQASGQRYGNFVREHIFQAIGMTESRIDASVHDMALWIRLQLAGGRLPVDHSGATQRLFGDAITLHVMDESLALPKTDWLAAYKASAQFAEAQAAESEAKQRSERVPDTKPSLALNRYVGSYRDRWYGDIDVQLIHGELRLRFSRSPRLVGSLSPWRADTFLATWDDRTLRADALIDFTVNEKNQITGAHMRRVDYQDLSLIKAP